MGGRYDIYEDIARRTGGDIYVGVVGPVRTGKSTFITKFMETLVIPVIKDKNLKQRTVDELPQSAAGKTIMTTQPKFVPSNAVKILLKDKVSMKVRMLDCVGYLVDGVMGHMEGDMPRLVKTPWSSADMPFEQAAEIGTQKVIKEHSTIGILITTDGSIADIPRHSYVTSEERVVAELKELNKPFIVILNSKEPKGSSCQKTRDALEERYQVPVLAVDIANMGMEEINLIFEKVLFEFPIKNIDISLPTWMSALDKDNKLINDLLLNILDKTKNYRIMKHHSDLLESYDMDDNFEKPEIKEVLPGTGKVVYSINAKQELFLKILSIEAGMEIKDDFTLMGYIRALSKSKLSYDRIKDALLEAESKGYGVVTPTMGDMSLEEPQIVRQGSKFGVRLKASAPSWHILKVDINTEVSPIVGTEQQSEELVKYLLSEFENDPKGIWETNMFGKSLNMLVKEGLTNKLHAMPNDAQEKMRRTIGRIVNEGKGGMICILL